MNLLFDQNISFRIIKRIEDIFPRSISVRDPGYDNPHDSDIWKYAKANNLGIVTFDSDFIDSSNLRGFPPKIIWLRWETLQQKILQKGFDRSIAVNADSDLIS